jgi:hypothetical protein
MHRDHNAAAGNAIKKEEAVGSMEDIEHASAKEAAVGEREGRCTLDLQRERNMGFWLRVSVVPPKQPGGRRYADKHDASCADVTVEASTIITGVLNPKGTGRCSERQENEQQRGHDQVGIEAFHVLGEEE